jgi:hypothetical protein
MTAKPEPSIAYYAGSDTWFYEIEVACRDEYSVVSTDGNNYHPDRVFETKEDAKQFVRENILTRIEMVKKELAELEIKASWLGKL